MEIIFLGIAVVCIIVIGINVKKHGSFSKWQAHHKQEIEKMKEANQKAYMTEMDARVKVNLTSLEVHKSPEYAESEEFLRLNNRGTFPNEARHFELDGLINNSNAQKDYMSCEKYCLEDIDLYPIYIAEMRDKEEKRLVMAKSELSEINSGRKNASPGYVSLLMRSSERTHIPSRFVSFETLIKIYEKQGRFNEAIEVCQKAIDYGISDGSKGGFESRKKRFENVLITLNDTESLDFIKDGFAFEEFVCGVLIQNGYKAETTVKSGDFGVDVIAEKDGIRYAVQCKLSANPVSLKAVQEVYAAMAHYKCNIGIVAATNTFTKSAEELAASTNVLLWDKRKIIELAQINNINSGKDDTHE